MSSDYIHGLQVNNWSGPTPTRARAHLAVYTKPGIATVGSIINGNHSDTVQINAVTYFETKIDAYAFIADARAYIGTVDDVVYTDATFSNQLLVNFEVVSLRAVVAFHNPADGQLYAPAWKLESVFTLVEKT